MAPNLSACIALARAPIWLPSQRCQRLRVRNRNPKHGQVHSVPSRSAPASMAGETSAAKARWELENGVQVATDIESLYKYDAAAQQAIQQQKPWAKDPHYFKQ